MIGVKYKWRNHSTIWANECFLIQYTNHSKTGGKNTILVISPTIIHKSSDLAGASTSEISGIIATVSNTRRAASSLQRTQLAPGWTFPTQHRQLTKLSTTTTQQSVDVRQTDKHFYYSQIINVNICTFPGESNVPDVIIQVCSMYWYGWWFWGGWGVE